MEWIKCEDRLPDDSFDVTVLAYGIATCATCAPRPQVRQCYYSDRYGENCFYFGEYDCTMEVTHWMPLPDAPK